MSERVRVEACGLMSDEYEDDPEYRLVKASALGRVYEKVDHD